MLSVEDDDDTLRRRYEAGFAACAAEVGRYLTSVDVEVLPQLGALLPHLVSHLAGCIHRRRCRDSRYADTPNKQVPIVADEASATFSPGGREAQSDYEWHNLSSQQQSAGDLDHSCLQASYFTKAPCTT